MPKFFFDIDDNGLLAIDNEGIDLLNASQAYSEAKRAIFELLIDLKPIVGRTTIGCTVRNNRNSVKYTLKMVTDEAFDADPHTAWGVQIGSATDMSH